MRRVVVNMQNTLFSNAICQTLRSSGNGLEAYGISSPDTLVEECRWLTPYALLMEVTGQDPWRVEQRLKIREAVKARQPECRIVLVVDENTERAAALQVKQAKKDGLIDQFVYGSISAAYLADIIDSL